MNTTKIRNQKLDGGHIRPSTPPAILSFPVPRVLPVAGAGGSAAAVRARSSRGCAAVSDAGNGDVEEAEGCRWQATAPGQLREAGTEADSGEAGIRRCPACFPPR